MGNFYCVPNSCAKVVYREYLPPVIRYRYSGGEWVEVNADSYTQETISAELDPATYYYWEMTVVWDYAFDDEEYIRNYSVWDLRFGSSGLQRIPNGRPLFNEIEPSRFELIIPYEYEDAGGNLRRVGYNFKLGSFYYARSWNVTLICEVPSSSARDCSQGEPPPEICKTTFYLKDAIVETLSGEECPEVEQLDCRLRDEYKEITIEKLAYLERVEVRNQEISTFFLPPLDTPFTEVNSLPEHSLNIYRTIVTAPPFLQETVPLPGAINPYVFIAQISSAPNCPPPQYTVICDCDSNNCESCPDGTCPVECDDHICCYASTGIAIKSIPIDKYCEE